MDNEIEQLVRDAITPFGVRIEVLVEELELLKISVERLELLVAELQRERDLPTWDGPDSP